MDGRAGLAAVPDAWPDPVPVYRALIEDDDLAAARSSLESGWLGMGETVGQFEDAVADALGVLPDRVVAVSTGSAALHVALLLAGVGAGDEVVVPSFSHLADVQAILACGAEPVFCDVSDETHCVGVPQVEAALGPRTRAVLALDYGGSLVDEQAIMAAVGPGIRVVRDAAHAFGASTCGRPVGSESDLCTFSFDPVKALTCIDGGVIVAPTADEATRARQIRILGSDQPAKVMYGNGRTWDYDAVDVGFRYHLSNLHAALGLRQLAKLARIRESRQRACRRYARNLEGRPGIQTAPGGRFGESNPFLFWIRVPAERRDALRDHLTSLGIDTGIHWRPAHRHTFFAGFRTTSLDVTEHIGDQILSLPLHSAPMDDAVIDRVCAAVLDHLG